MYQFQSRESVTCEFIKLIPQSTTAAWYLNEYRIQDKHWDQQFIRKKIYSVNQYLIILYKQLKVNVSTTGKLKYLLWDYAVNEKYAPPVELQCNTYKTSKHKSTKTIWYQLLLLKAESVNTHNQKATQPKYETATRKYGGSCRQSGNALKVIKVNRNSGEPGPAVTNFSQVITQP